MAIKYYDAKKNWRKIKRHIEHPDVQTVLVRDFNKFTYGRWRNPFKPGMLPHTFESCDWWCDHRGRMPAFWQYVKHAACHWLVNFNFELAKRVEPDRDWCIISTQKHSTVWDGDELLFDFNFQALGVTPEESFKLAGKGHGRKLKKGQWLPVHYAEHYSHDVERLKKQRAELIKQARM